MLRHTWKNASTACKELLTGPLSGRCAAQHFCLMQRRAGCRTLTALRESESAPRPPAGEARSDTPDSISKRQTLQWVGRPLALRLRNSISENAIFADLDAQQLS